MAIIGEDPDELEYKVTNQSGQGPKKPLRYLSDFAFFDARKELEMVSLDVLDGADGTERYEAAGYVAPVFLNEEDAGQEDEEEEGAMQRLRTSRAVLYSLNYASEDEPVYLETQFAWYILRNPSSAYRAIYQDFYQPRRITQMVVTAALRNPDWRYKDFQDNHLEAFDDLLGRRLGLAMINSAIPTMKHIVPRLPDIAKLRTVPLIRELVGNEIRPVANGGIFPVVSRTVNLALAATTTTTNLDLAVLLPKNQNPTQVTPLVDKLGFGLFRGRIQVVGPSSRKADKVTMGRFRRQERLKLVRYVQADRSLEKKVVFPGSERLRGVYWKAVQVDDVEYRIGDCVVARAGAYEGRAEPRIPVEARDLPEDAPVADYFWFGKIVFINQQTKQMHVQWFEHASKTILQEICNPRELFLTMTCSDVDVSLVAGKVIVRYTRPDPLVLPSELDPFDYFCTLSYSDKDGSFTALPQNSGMPSSDPPDNCPVCRAALQDDAENFPQAVDDGFTFHGTEYHVADFVLVLSSDVVCRVGQIEEISWSNSARDEDGGKFKFRALGRISDLVNLPGCPEDVIKDERHLYLTDEVYETPMRQIAGKCTVVHADSFADAADFERYLSASPYHFYARFKFTEAVDEDGPAWRHSVPIDPEEFILCNSCAADLLERLRQLKEFRALRARKPLRTFDPFGGVGAFSAGMEEAGCIKLTHAVEISPSAAETLKKNSPDVVVYNQCSNIMLRYAIKKHKGHDVEVPMNLADKSLVADPPQPGSVDCIVAGFPCQPHSRLNMFQRANDNKSHLMLTLCSWVDFLRPKYCFFENVRGFLQYKLNATQAGRFRVEGGIEMGGLKWFINSLLEMNYQVRYGLLQAAHYGTPQARVRFFLIAAQPAHPLPAFPVPVYDFPEKDALEIRSANLPKPIAPLNAATKPIHHFVTVDDAIGDLPRFDWASPRRPSQPPRRIPHPEDPTTESIVPSLPCDKTRAFCGYHGPNAMYHHEKPRTAFQKRCREKPVTDLQHYTKVSKAQVVERVVNIPLRAKADYRTLKQSDWEWQFSNPSSAVARDGFRPGLYGRLDKDGYFRTTVTNVEPTAKQSWVLNPFCKRVVTVRELARSQGFPDHFVFYSKNNDVKTMQRQIGNAVPWPVSVALGRELSDAMMKKWIDDKANAITIV
ncbi:S-adenosyl-L-methionine-dependent methyltransferase [Cristinia sonorae]|uniref:DNA (cytosine-5-)-methyltransferase n=1 Tax=Cristinia sonorae TaxID=1940300 RepID=A0A8K0XPR2_9AGAR|nr:S-adenosyl-L-methionine-dependent methyltransferase [Cristinia sonorae]